MRCGRLVVFLQQGGSYRRLATIGNDYGACDSKVTMMMMVMVIKSKVEEEEPLDDPEERVERRNVCERNSVRRKGEGTRRGEAKERERERERERSSCSHQIYRRVAAEGEKEDDGDEEQHHLQKMQEPRNFRMTRMPLPLLLFFISFSSLLHQYFFQYFLNRRLSVTLTNSNQHMQQ